MTPLRLAVVSQNPLAPGERRALAALLFRTGLDITLTQIEGAQGVLYYGEAPPEILRGSKPVLSIPRADYAPEGRAWQSELWKLLNRLKASEEFSLDPMIVQLSRSASARLTVDLLGLFRAALEGWDERNAGRDEHGRFPPEKSIAAHVKVLHRPFLDEMGIALGKLLLRLAGIEANPAPRPWYYCPTFDIDSTGMFIGRAAARSMRDIARSGFWKIPAACWLAARVQIRIARDPHLRIRELAEALEGMDVPATFFAQAIRKHRRDNYALRNSGRLVDEIKSVMRNRFHQVGLHSSYATRDSPPEFFAAHWKELRRNLGKGIAAAHRAHWLRTPEDFAYASPAKEKPLVDSSIGFGRHEGFRRGTALPFRLDSGVIEMPPSAMDTTLRYFRQCDAKGARLVMVALMDRVRRSGGVFVPIWHPNNFDPFLWPEWEDVVYDVTRAAKKGGAICQPLARTALELQTRADGLERDLERLAT